MDGKFPPVLRSAIKEAVAASSRRPATTTHELEAFARGLADNATIEAWWQYSSRDGASAQLAIARVVEMLTPIERAEVIGGLLTVHPLALQRMRAALERAVTAFIVVEAMREICERGRPELTPDEVDAMVVARPALAQGFAR